VPKAPPLSDAEVASRLASLPGWRRGERALVKSFAFRDFREALEFVNRLADPADEQNHHPDVHIHWNEVTLELWTHAAGAITERDFRLADSVERIAGG
jgi:4a-hydroxytetrahydrobiopterin dehydratase